MILFTGKKFYFRIFSAPSFCTDVKRWLLTSNHYCWYFAQCYVNLHLFLLHIFMIQSTKTIFLLSSDKLFEDKFPLYLSHSCIVSNLNNRQQFTIFFENLLENLHLTTRSILCNHFSASITSNSLNMKWSWMCLTQHGFVALSIYIWHSLQLNFQLCSLSKSLDF